ncbi:MAG: DNA-binding transcriptional regulator [Pirellulales bacterium]
MPKKRRVAVVIDLEWPLAHHQRVFAGIHRYASQRGGWNCSIDPYLDLTANHRGDSHQLDGIVGRIPALLAKQARRRGVPLVNVWANSPAANVVSVLHDAAGSGRMATRHLIARGYRNFAYLGIAHDKVSLNQLAGFREVLAEHEYPCDECWTQRLHPEVKRHWQAFQKQLGAWIDGLSPPIGVFATTDLLTRYIAEAVQEHDLRLPADMALIGSGNEMAICSTPEPSLSSIDFGFERIGYRAAELLDEMMAGATPPSEPQFLPPVQLAVRASSGAFAVDHPLVTEVLAYIGENLPENLSLEHLAAQVATTPRTLSRLFRSSLGKSVHQTIIQLRLERAKRELIENDDLLKVIATRCGFRDAIHLCKVFQREHQITPSDYRANHRKE